MVVSFSDCLYYHPTFSNCEYDRSSLSKLYTMIDICDILKELKLYKQNMEVHPESVQNFGHNDSRLINNHRKKKINENISI